MQNTSIRYLVIFLGFIFIIATPVWAADPVVELDGLGVATQTTSGGTLLDLWVKVTDSDGITFDFGTGQSSHTVIVQPPVGDPLYLVYNPSTDPNSAYFSAGLNPAATPYNLDDYAGAWTFTVTDPDTNTGTIVDTLTIAPLPYPDENTFEPADGTTVANTTPKITWDALTGTNAGNVKRYQVIIYTDSGTIRVTSGDVDTGNYYTVPRGVLAPDMTYRYRIDAFDAEIGSDTDNWSKAPALNENFPAFTTGSETTTTIPGIPLLLLDD
jgi:hypothetical protein